MKPSWEQPGNAFAESDGDVGGGGDSGEWEDERRVTIPIMPDASCVMFFGPQGSGKSAVMAKNGKDEARMGKPVWYWPPDYHFKYGKPIDLLSLVSMPDWLNHGALLIDEIQILASNLRTVSTANQMIGGVLQQLRKRALNVYGTSNQPMRIDRTVSLQTDLHYSCFMVKDIRCTTKHLLSCDDHVRMSWVDTNGKWGRDWGHKDGRKRGRTVLYKVRDMYPIYRSGAIADMADVMSVTKAKVLSQKLDSTAGLPFAELVQNLRTTWIPYFVTGGTKRVTPANMAMALNEDLGYNINPATIGKALREIGIAVVKTNQGRFAQLPPEEHLETWMRDGDWPRE